MVDLFPNRTGECFSSSVASLLAYRFRDMRTAKALFDRAPDHPLIASNNGGTEIGTWPYLVNALTNGRYAATLSLNLPSVEDLLDHQPEGIDRTAYRDAVQHGIDTGRIFVDGRVLKPLPVIVSVIKNVDTDPSGHVVVYIGRDVDGNEHYIDNGNIGIGSMEGHALNGYLSVYRQPI